MSTTRYQTVRLSRGKHSSPDEGACVMELASMLAGERFSDRPRSVSPVIAAFLRGYNDLVDERRRQDLIRYAAEAVGTAASEEVEHARVRRLVQWADERSRQSPRPTVLGPLGPCGRDGRLQPIRRAWVSTRFVRSTAGIAAPIGMCSRCSTS